MKPKQYMTFLIADILCMNDQFKGDRLNDEAVWEKFMDELLKQMGQIQDENIREALQSIDVDDFQQWINAPSFWITVNEEVEKRMKLCKNYFLSDPEGGCC